MNDTNDLVAQARKPNIGDLNGRWSFLFKIMLATYPFLLIWSTFVTVETVVNREFRREISEKVRDDVAECKRNSLDIARVSEKLDSHIANTKRRGLE